jgi:hypothetical protein
MQHMIHTQSLPLGHFECAYCWFFASLLRPCADWVEAHFPVPRVRACLSTPRLMLLYRRHSLRERHGGLNSSSLTIENIDVLPSDENGSCSPEALQLAFEVHPGMTSRSFFSGTSAQAIGQPNYLDKSTTELKSAIEYPVAHKIMGSRVLYTTSTASNGAKRGLAGLQPGCMKALTIRRAGSRVITNAGL